MHPTIHQPIVTAGVEEEFHIVDLATRRLTDQRAACARGGLSNVVDTLAAETRATPPWLQDTGPARPAVSAA